MTVDPYTPSRRLLYTDYTVLCSAPDGTISRDPEGLYEHDTRILSRHNLTIDGQALRFVSTADLAADRRLTVLLAPRPGGSASGPVLPQDAVEVRMELLVGPGMVERLTLVNRTMVSVAPTLRLEVDADFADVMEIGRARRQRGKTSRTTLAEGGLQLTYRATRGRSPDRAGRPGPPRGIAARVGWQSGTCMASGAGTRWGLGSRPHLRGAGRWSVAPHSARG